jgi:EAL domain-containing protein (putative c-di-GMP-specific phosphodiesterase class I)
MAAIEQDQFELYFQPQIELDSERVFGAEALLRWKHPQRGFVRPDYFIPIAEHSNLIHRITDWTIHAALWLINDWPKSVEPLNVSVNLSPKIFECEGLIESIIDMATISNVDLDHLTLEVTESALMEDMGGAIRILNQLKEMGVNISIDDFGSGYSSMSYFKSIPANELKVDQSFVTNMLENPMDLHIVRSIIDMAHGFGLKVVAEGIENRESLEFLKTLGCDIGQGYYISEPLQQEAFIEWLRQYNDAIDQVS